MFSPALRNRQKVLARQSAREAKKPRRAGRKAPGQAASSGAPAPDERSQSGSEYAALLAVLHEDLRNLSDIASHEARQPKKAEMAKKFSGWVDGVIAADEPVQDEIVTTMMIWAIDYRDFERALDLAAFVLKHDLTLPERYSRTAACFVAEEIATLALQQHEEVPHQVLMDVAAMTHDFDMPDPVQAKVQKAIGRSWMRKAEHFDPASESAPAGAARSYAEAARSTLERALELDGQVGVKKDIQAAKSLIKKLTAEAVQQE